MEGMGGRGKTRNVVASFGKRVLQVVVWVESSAALYLVSLIVVKFVVEGVIAAVVVRALLEIGQRGVQPLVEIFKLMTSVFDRKDEIGIFLLIK